MRDMAGLLARLIAPFRRDIYGVYKLEPPRTNRRLEAHLEKAKAAARERRLSI